MAWQVALAWDVVRKVYSAKISTENIQFMQHYNCAWIEWRPSNERATAACVHCALWRPSKRLAMKMRLILLVCLSLSNRHSKHLANVHFRKLLIVQSEKPHCLIWFGMAIGRCVLLSGCGNAICARLSSIIVCKRRKWANICKAMRSCGV